MREYAGEECIYWFTIPADLVSTNIRDREIDWSNSIFLSMQFEVGAVGKFNEFLYTFLKCLSRDRIEYVENWYAEQSDVDEDVAARRLGRAAPLPAPARRSRPVRFHRRHDVDLRPAQLEVQPGHGSVPDISRTRDPRPPTRHELTSSTTEKLPKSRDEHWELLRWVAKSAVQCGNCPIQGTIQERHIAIPVQYVAVRDYL